MKAPGSTRDRSADLQTTLKAIARTAAQVCEARDALIYLADGDEHRVVAKYGRALRAGQRIGDTRSISRGTPLGRALLERRSVHVPDLNVAVRREFREVGELYRIVGARTVLATPLLRDGVALGGIVIRRRERRPFSAKQITLLKTFADQAVIAIENVRLFTELQEKNRALTAAHAQVTEALEQQTATAEILRVISSSPTATQPVFDVIVQSAVRLCGAHLGALVQVQGNQIHQPALLSINPEGGEAVRRAFPLPLDTSSRWGCSILQRRIVHVPDVEDPEAVPGRTDLSRAAGFRSQLTVPMLRKGEAIGALRVARSEPGPYSERQIELLQTFADQAVIAIENVRLFTELQEKNRALTEAHAQVSESLEQQTATAEILSVISGSPTDTRPVFDAVLDRALTLCEASHGSIYQLEDGALRHVGVRGTIGGSPTVGGVISLESVQGRAVLEKRTVHFEDVLQELDWQAPEVGAGARRTGVRTLVAVPLLREQTAIGAILIRRLEVRPFSEKQIRLLQTFADQAVVAIENVRLFKELEARNRDLTTALDQQTATSEILRVISSSPTDVQPVFDAIVQSAVHLCTGLFGTVTRFDGELVHLAAHHNFTREALEAARRAFPVPASRGMVSGRAILERNIVHVPDTDDYDSSREWSAEGRALVRAVGYRSILSVPMLKGGDSVGAITIGRAQVGPFSDNEITLLQTFADQAVIAIENVRLFTELQQRNADVTEALEQQTATSEVLRVISSSPTDVQPIFDVISKTAARLCDAMFGGVFRSDGQVIRVVATHNAAEGRPDDATYRQILVFPVARTTVPGRAILDQTVVHSADIQVDPAFGEDARAAARALGGHAIVGVPLIHAGRAVGAILVARDLPTPFSDRQIKLLSTFADQAVIAIENVRLFTELQRRNREVTEALEQQTATAEILRAISGSPTDLQPVFDAIVQSSARLCEAAFTSLFRFDGQLVTFEAHHGMTEAEVEAGRQRFPRAPNRETASGRAILDRQIVHIHDIRVDPEYRAAGQTTFRTVLAIPLLREGMPVGAMSLWRREVRPFSDAQVAVVKTFADQAVIAIENVRLFKELEARTQDLTRSVGELRALGEIGQAISSTLDLQTVLSTIVARATQLAGTDAGVIYEYDEEREVFVPCATERLEAEIVETMLAAPVRKGEGATGRLAEVQGPIQLPDIFAAPAESRVRDVLVRAGYRALLAVPLVREDHLIGGLTVIRKATGEFPAEIIDLLRTFATQSALAIQNARLFREIEEKSRELEAASRHKSEFLSNMSHCCAT